MYMMCHSQVMAESEKKEHTNLENDQGLRNAWSCESQAGGAAPALEKGMRLPGENWTRRGFVKK